MTLSRRTFLIAAGAAAAAVTGLVLVEARPKPKSSAGSYTSTYRDTY